VKERQITGGVELCSKVHLPKAQDTMVAAVNVITITLLPSRAEAYLLPILQSMMEGESKSASRSSIRL